MSNKDLKLIMNVSFLTILFSIVNVLLNTSVQGSQTKEIGVDFVDDFDSLRQRVIVAHQILNGKYKQFECSYSEIITNVDARSTESNQIEYSRSDNGELYIINKGPRIFLVRPEKSFDGSNGMRVVCYDDSNAFTLVKTKHSSNFSLSYYGTDVQENQKYINDSTLNYTSSPSAIALIPIANILNSDSVTFTKIISFVDSDVKKINFRFVVNPPLGDQQKSRNPHGFNDITNLGVNSGAFTLLPDSEWAVESYELNKTNLARKSLILRGRLTYDNSSNSNNFPVKVLLELLEAITSDKQPAKLMVKSEFNTLMLSLKKPDFKKFALGTYGIRPPTVALSKSSILFYILILFVASLILAATSIAFHMFSQRLS